MLKEMVSKAERLVKCNKEFLRELAVNINLSHRSYFGKDKKELIELLCKKLGVEDVDRVIKLYMVCLEPREVAEVVRPNGISKIVRMVQDFFDYEIALQEKRIGRLRCDLVLISDSKVMAFEIKTARDTISRAIEQTNYYCLWANQVYLAYDVKHKATVRRMEFNGIGLLEISKDNAFLIHSATENQINPLNLLRFLPYAYLRRLASNYGVRTLRKKRNIVGKLNAVLPPNVVHKHFLDYLTSETVVN